jgi:membrane protease YdiL (CAAX protease family)
LTAEITLWSVLSGMCAGHCGIAFPSVILSEAMQSSRIAKTLAPATPYLTIAGGLLLLHSAWVALISYHLTAILVMLLSKHDLSFRGVGHRTRLLLPTISAVLGASAGVILIGMWSIFGLDRSLPGYMRDSGLSGGAWTLFMAYFVIVNPWVEEFFWRGFLRNPGRGPVLNDFLFSGYHLIVFATLLNPLLLAVSFVVLAVTSCFWRQANRMNGSLLPSIASHVAADLAVVIVVGIRSSAIR